MRTNVAMSLSRVCDSMKVLSGATPRSSAVLVSMLPAMYGVTASVRIWSMTGDITNSVRNSARPISTWFGGDWPAPSACRRIDSTMMMRVNAVIISSSAGSSVIAVISASSSMVSV